MPRPPSLPGAIKFNDIIWSRGTCIILTSLSEVVLQESEGDSRDDPFIPQDSPSFALHCLPSISEI